MMLQLPIHGEPSPPNRFIDWEEQFVSHDRGNRVVHYYLKDGNGSMRLAVIGTERSLRHMVYVVSDEFLPIAHTHKPALKWRSRREVVDWLATFLSMTRSSSPITDHPHPSKFHKHESSPISDPGATTIGEDMDLVGGLAGNQISTQGWEVKKHHRLSVGNVMWVGVAWTCRRRLQHYQSFQRNGITISVHDFVFMTSEGKDHHIAHIEDLYEDKKSKKKVRVRWFHRTEEVVCSIPVPAPHSKEVFITPFPEVLSVESIDGLATVLTPEHYEKCLQTLPADVLAQTYMCSRQFDSEDLKPFNVTDMRGYWHQKTLTLVRSASSQESSPNCDLATDHMEMVGEDEETDAGCLIRRGRRTARFSGRRVCMAAQLRRCHNKNVKFSYPQGMSRLATVAAAVIGLGSSLGERGPSYNIDNLGKDAAYYDQAFPVFGIGDKIELLCQDSGVRGCWFRCTIIRRICQRVKVRYEELDTEDGCNKLEEWVSSAKVAPQDSLGMRMAGRLIMRPSPSQLTQPVDCEVGSAVDAWWNDGWWEGVVLSKKVTGEVYVYFPGENETAAFQLPDLRVSRDWFDGCWVDVRNNSEFLRSFGLIKSCTAFERSLCGTGGTDMQRDVPMLGFSGTGYKYTSLPAVESLRFRESSVPPFISGLILSSSCRMWEHGSGDCTCTVHQRDDPCFTSVAQLDICTSNFDYGQGEQRGHGKHEETVQYKKSKFEQVCIVEEHLPVDELGGIDEMERGWLSSRKKQCQVDLMDATCDKTKEMSKDCQVEDRCNSELEEVSLLQNKQRKSNEELNLIKERPGQHEKPVHGSPINCSLLMKSPPCASLVLSS